MLARSIVFLFWSTISSIHAFSPLPAHNHHHMNRASLSKSKPLVDSVFRLSGGASASTSLSVLPKDNMLSKVLEPLPPRGSAAVWMAISMALHFGGYEFARSSNLALFTSSETGFTSPAAFPLAMACVSPVSVLLLMGYGRELEQHGPRVALRHTTLFSMFALGGLAVLISVWEKSQIMIPLGGSRVVSLSKILVGLAFILQNSYAHLIYSQQWSFIGSILTPTEGSTWFASIAGLSSITSTLSGSFISVLVEKVGLLGLMGCNVFSLLLSLLCAEQAYSTSDKHGFNPEDEMTQKAQDKKKGKKKTNDETDGSKSQITKARDLFRRVPTLGALFCEVLSFQSLSTILNVCLVTKLKSSITVDSERAAWAGQFYATVNGVSGMFQFLVLPLFLKRIEPKWVWRFMPLIPLVCSVIQNLQVDPSLYVLAFSFFCAKTMDYSLRNVVNEMVYQPLDFESRYLGKEVIGVFGNRFGKSGMSLVLSALAYAFEGFGIVQLSALSTVASLSWMSCAVWLSGLIPKREVAEKVVDQRRKNTKRKKG